MTTLHTTKSKYIVPNSYQDFLAKKLMYSVNNYLRGVDKCEDAEMLLEILREAASEFEEAHLARETKTAIDTTTNDDEAQDTNQETAQ